MAKADIVDLPIQSLHVLAAVRDLDNRIVHAFGKSTGYDLIHEGKRYPPKAVLALAARHAANVTLGPYDFKGGDTSQSFRILRNLGFTIEKKGDDRDWSEDEVRTLVADYFDMLAKDTAGLPYSKAQHRRALLPKLNGRTEGSIEFKHQNVTAALLELGFPYIPGYKPAVNFQRMLTEIVLEYIGTEPEVISRIEQVVAAPVEPLPAVLGTFEGALSDPPVIESTPAEKRARVRVGRKVDFRRKDEANRELGRAGEDFVVHFERWRLTLAYKPELAAKVRWLADEDGDGAGYDIESFELDGSKIFIEVKTTKLGIAFPFLITKNELEAAEELGDAYRIYRVYQYGKHTKLYIMPGSPASTFELEPCVYSAKPRRAQTE